MPDTLRIGTELGMGGWHGRGMRSNLRASASLRFRCFGGGFHFSFALSSSSTSPSIWPWGFAPLCVLSPVLFYLLVLCMSSLINEPMTGRGTIQTIKGNFYKTKDRG